MATILGRSKVWGSITSNLQAVSLSANHPKELESLLAHCQFEYEQKYRSAYARLQGEILDIQHEISQEEVNIQSGMKKVHDETYLDIEQAEANLDLYKQDRSIFNFIRNYFRVRREARKLTQLQEDTKDKQKALSENLVTKEQIVEQKKAQIDILAKGECSAIAAQIACLKDMAGSNEITNATAELELLEALAQLPANNIVINNLDLKLERGILFQSKWLIKGHIDHLVITPAGLFAIEVRNWNKQNAAESSRTNIYEPIKLSAQLCYEVIKNDYPGLTVRSILAYRGHQPDNQNSGIVKVLQLHEVSGYILWFKDKLLTDFSLNQLTTFIQELNTN